MNADESDEADEAENGTGKVQTLFHLNCNAVIPACGYRCDRCIDELTAVVTSTPGVSGVSMIASGQVQEL